MTQVTKKSEFVEFEILQETEKTPRTASPWATFRFVAMGLAGLALFGGMLAFGMLVTLPLLIFFAIARIISTLLPAGARR